MNDQNCLSIKEKLEKNIYNLDSCPRILYLRNGKIFINKNAPYPDELEALDDSILFIKDLEIPTEKLRATSFGDWLCEVRTINSKYFATREKFDDLFISKSERKTRHDWVSANRISIRRALEKIGAKIRCNMDYYLNHQNELENDLDRKIDLSIELKKENRKKLEKELFYKLMCKLFGNEGSSEAENDQKQFMLNDLRLLSFDGNDLFASAKRGNYYFLFYYSSG